MMEDRNRWPTIYDNYLNYTNRYDKEGMINVTGDYLPLQAAVLNDDVSNVSITGNVGALERELLLEFGNSNPRINSLNPRELACLPIGLTEILRVQITDDHREYWKLTADITNKLDSDTLGIPENILNVFELLVALVLATPTVPRSRDRWSENWVQSRILEKSSILASYSGFPILEAFLKAICDEYVKMNGYVKPGKILETHSGPIPENNLCTSVGGFLYHIENEMADPDLADRLEMMRERVADLYDWDSGEVYGTDGLSGLRNSWLHGKEAAKAENGVILNYICLLIWETVAKKVDM